MDSENTNKQRHRIWLPVIIIVLLWLMCYPFAYRKIDNYKNYIINRKYAVDYVNKTYGGNFEVEDLIIRSLEVPIFTTSSSGYYDYDTFKIIDKNEIEPDFRVKFFKGKISNDYYYEDRNQYFFQQHYSKYIEQYISKDDYKFEMLFLYCSPTKYNTYEEMLSDKNDIENWSLYMYIRIYNQNKSDTDSIKKCEDICKICQQELYNSGFKECGIGMYLFDESGKSFYNYKDVCYENALNGNKTK